MSRVRVIEIMRRGPRGAPGDMDPAEWDALQDELDAKLPIADVLNEPDMATGATDKPPSQASVVEYVTDGLATKVSKTGDESIDGVKTFTSSPVVPEPEDDDEAANKHYVDVTAGVLFPTLLLPLDGDLTGRNSDGAVSASATGPLRWRDGSTNDTQAALIEDAATNVHPNPMFDTNSAGHFVSGATIARTTTWAYMGRASGRLTATATAAHLIRNDTFSSGQLYQIGIVVRNTAAGPRTAQMRVGASTVAGDPVVIPAGEIRRVTGQFTGTGSAQTPRVVILDAQVGDIFYIGHVQIEPGTVLSSPVPEVDSGGTIQSGYAWTGTAHASSSTRTATVLSIPIDAFPAHLSIRYSEDNGVTWDHAFLTEPGTFGAHGEVAFDTDHLDISSSGTLLVEAVRADGRVLNDAERSALIAAERWSWSGLRSMFGLAGEGGLAAHLLDTDNPHEVTKAQVGLGNVDNTADLDKPINTATQAALDLKADLAAFLAHKHDTKNPHGTTKAQVGLGRVDNTSDAEKPLSVAMQAAINQIRAELALDHARQEGDILYISATGPKWGAIDDVINGTADTTARFGYGAFGDGTLPG